jgi:hypothetical protein
MKKLGGWFNPEAQSTISQAICKIKRFSQETPAILIPTNNQEGILEMTLEMY